MATKNFTDAELACQCGCGFLPTKEAQESLQSLREAWGKPMKITSAARCKTYNRNVGGVPDSEHSKGQAFDVALMNNERWAFVKLAIEHGWHGIGIAVTFIHIDLRDKERARVWNYSNK